MRKDIGRALLADELPEEIFDDVAEYVHTGRAPRLDPAAVRKLHQHTRTWIDRHPPRAYSLARFGLLAAPRVPARTAADRAVRQLLIAESYRAYAAVCVARRFINEAQKAVLDARAQYAAPGIAPFTTEAALVEISVAWIMFYQDAVPLAVRSMERLAQRFLDEFHDERFYVITRQYVAGMLAGTNRLKEALAILNDILDLTKERGLATYVAGIIHNITLCRKQLGEPCPPELIDDARELLEQQLEGHAPCSAFILAEQLKAANRTAEAISELYKVRAEYEARGDAVIAAATVRCIVELLVPEGRLTEARFVGEAAIAELESAGMLLEARLIRELLGGPEQKKRRLG